MRKLLFLFLRFTGIPFLFREFVQKNKVSMILLHDIDPQTADQTFGYLCKHYNVICLNEFLEARKANDAARLPPKAMIVTFDDGHLRNHDLLPVIQKYKMPLTIFLCTAVINTKRRFWFMHEHETIDREALKRVSNKDKLSRLSEVGFGVETEFPETQAMSKSQIMSMKDAVNMQSHTATHPILPMCDNEEARTELFESKRALEEDYGFEVNTISYPNGDYSDREIELAKEAGYECGVTVDFGFNTLSTDVLRLKRLCVNDTDDLNELVVKASGAWAFFKTRNGRKQQAGHMKNIVDQQMGQPR